MKWSELEAGAPEIARHGKVRLLGPGVAMLGTLAADGSPYISPVEPCFAQGHLLFGVMPRSAKARHLGRDPRCVLHSAVSTPDSGEDELKLYGRAMVADEAVRNEARDGWWTDRPRGDAVVYSLEIERAVLVSWDIERGEMTTQRWTPRAGYSQETRAYP